MAPQPRQPMQLAHAAALQRSRTLQSSFKSSLIKGGAMQMQSKSQAYPALPEPAAALLYSNSSRDLRKPLPPEMLNGPKRFSRSRSPVQDSVPTALRDRVAMTPYLSSTLRTECLERLDQIVVPRKMCRRPSWTHLEDDVPEAQEDAGLAFAAKLSGQSGATSLPKTWEPVVLAADQSAEAYELVFSLDADTSVKTIVVDKPKEAEAKERAAILNWKQEFLAAPAPIPECAPIEAQADASPTLGKPKRRREQQSQSQEEPRYLQLWTLDDCAANVWKSTAKGAASTNTSSTAQDRTGPRASLSNIPVATTEPQSLNTAATELSRRKPLSLTERKKQKSNIQAMRSAVELARSELTRYETHERQAQNADDENLPDAGAPSRGVTSMLRSSLRYSLRGQP